MKEQSREKLNEVTKLRRREDMGLNPGCLVSEVPLSVTMLCDEISKLGLSEHGPVDYSWKAL